MQGDGQAESYVQLRGQNIVEVVEPRLHTEESVQFMVHEVLDLKHKHNATKLLVDLKHAELPSLKTRKAVMEMLENAQFEKIAIVYQSRIMRTMARFIMHAVGHEHSETFMTKMEAIQWLEEEKP